MKLSIFFFFVLIASNSFAQAPRSYQSLEFIYVNNCESEGKYEPLNYGHFDKMEDLMNAIATKEDNKFFAFTSNRHSPKICTAKNKRETFLNDNRKPNKFILDPIFKLDNKEILNALFEQKFVVTGNSNYYFYFSESYLRYNITKNDFSFLQFISFIPSETYWVSASQGSVKVKIFICKDSKQNLAGSVKDKIEEKIKLIKQTKNYEQFLFEVEEISI